MTVSVRDRRRVSADRLGARLVFLPGLGADAALFGPQARAFPGSLTPSWIEPGRREGLGAYAERFGRTLEVDGPWVAVGFSFGGMVALEMASRLPMDRRPSGVVLISGVRSRAAVSGGFRVQRAVGGLVPRGLVRRALDGPLAGVFARRDGLDAAPARDLAAMARRADLGFLLWGSGACCRWGFDGVCPVPVRHVHGRRDRIIPYVPHPALEGGVARLVDAGHLITWTAADEVNRFIEGSVRSMVPQDDSMRP
jgi:pimeloyl-ACP methyl ester carboxylesterase